MFEHQGLFGVVVRVYLSSLFFLNKNGDVTAKRNDGRLASVTAELTGSHPSEMPEFINPSSAVVCTIGSSVAKWRRKSARFDIKRKSSAKNEVVASFDEVGNTSRHTFCGLRNETVSRVQVPFVSRQSE